MKATLKNVAFSFSAPLFQRVPGLAANHLLHPATRFADLRYPFQTLREG
ncbi:hypothetical protein [Janthinobacterium sp. PC23-8]|nr:hypothetical protein [Janthinobacterium sp. PC23-8]